MKNKNFDPNIGKNTQFSSTNQPSPEAKAKGRVLFEQRKYLKEDTFKTFAEEMIDTDGIKRQPFEVMVKSLRQIMFDKKIKPEIRANIMTKFMGDSMVNVLVVTLECP